MSVLRIPVRVTRTLIAPTLMVLTAVLVSKDLMEMDSLVKVLKCEHVLEHYHFETGKTPSLNLVLS